MNKLQKFIRMCKAMGYTVEVDESNHCLRVSLRFSSGNYLTRLVDTMSLTDFNGDVEDIVCELVGAFNSHIRNAL